MFSKTPRGNDKPGTPATRTRVWGTITRAVCKVRVPAHDMKDVITWKSEDPLIMLKVCDADGACMRVTMIMHSLFCRWICSRPGRPRRNRRPRRTRCDCSCRGPDTDSVIVVVLVGPANGGCRQQRRQCRQRGAGRALKRPGTRCLRGHWRWGNHTHHSLFAELCPPGIQLSGDIGLF